MARTATVIAVAVALLLMALSTAATGVYWVPAHEMAPPGGVTAPAACDLDGDSDYDVSAFERYPIQHYWNTGSLQVPSWQLDETQFPGLLVCNFRYGAFADLNADGDQDLVIGCYYGDLHMYWNIGTPHVPVWQHAPSMFQGLTVDPKPAPCLADMDADGDLDLVIATDRGIDQVRYVENTGTATCPAWTYRGVIVGVFFDVEHHAQVALGDLDGDGDLDMVGSSHGAEVLSWENVGTPQAFQFVESPAMLTGVPGVPQGTHGLALADFNADGRLDLLIAGSNQNYLYLNEPVTPVDRTSWSVIKAFYR